MMGALAEDEKEPSVQQVRDVEFSETKEIISVDEQTGEIVEAGNDNNPFE